MQNWLLRYILAIKVGQLGVQGRSGAGWELFLAKVDIVWTVNGGLWAVGPKRIVLAHCAVQLRQGWAGPVLCAGAVCTRIEGTQERKASATKEFSRHAGRRHREGGGRWTGGRRDCRNREGGPEWLFVLEATAVMGGYMKRQEARVSGGKKERAMHQ